MKILVFGSGGQVGSQVVSLARGMDMEFFAFAHADLDIANENAVKNIFVKFCPTHVVNAAAYNAVDRAEDDSENAFRTNALGPKILARACLDAKAILLHYSTDYVFDGTKTTDYTEKDKPNPLSVYASSKLEGEQNILSILSNSYVLRTACIFTPGGNNFVSRVLEIARSGKPLRFINDRLCTPTYAEDLARATFSLLKMKAPFGIYHAAGSEVTTPYEWAKLVVKLAKFKINVEPITASEFKTRAIRPVRSVIRNDKLKALGIEISSGLARLPDYFNSKESIV